MSKDVGRLCYLNMHGAASLDTKFYTFAESEEYSLVCVSSLAARCRTLGTSRKYRPDAAEF
jgi:hypothetical protein